MQSECARADVGCLLIEDIKPGTDCLSGLRAAMEAAGMAVGEFRLTRAARLHEHLQEAYYEVRRRCAAPTIAAMGRAGCIAALALAEQLPAERIALIGGVRDGGPARCRNLPGPLERLRGFAMRNLTFCTADILLIEPEGGGPALPARRLAAARGRLTAASMPAGLDGALSPEARRAVLNFLQSGELPKSLAETAEMCIIYG